MGVPRGRFAEWNQFAGDLPAHRERQFQAWVQISMGCNSVCSYCIVPAVRGREQSRRPGDIVAEVTRLADDGVREVTLLGQNVNSWGRDLVPDVRTEFGELLRAVDAVAGIERIRFTSPHPKDFREPVIRAMAECAAVCEHTHLPLQSGSSRVLKRMRRTYGRERYLELVGKMRAAVPDLALTTDIIVGFPGETEEDFRETLEVVEEVRYDGAFTFVFSPRRGTEAATMPDQVPDEVKARAHRAAHRRRPAHCARAERGARRRRGGSPRRGAEPHGSRCPARAHAAQHDGQLPRHRGGRRSRPGAHRGGHVDDAAWDRDGPRRGIVTLFRRMREPCVRQ